MPSPFPGMNPYLESPRVWEDFRDRFLVYAAEAIGPQAGPNFVVRIAAHVFVHDAEPDGDRREFHADLALTPPPDTADGRAVLAAPATVTLPARYRRRRVSDLEVRDRDGGEVVFVVELLSPSNKQGDREQFEAKRQALLAGSASYVEIDLLRGGRRFELGGDAGVPILRRREPPGRPPPDRLLADPTPGPAAAHPDPSRAVHPGTPARLTSRPAPDV